jgi:HlyD family secretion protein
MNRKRIAVPIVLLLVVSAGVLLVLGLRRSDTAAPVRASGTLEATEADLGFAVPGRIAWIAVREGEHVDAGQELARLDVAELQARRSAAAAQAEAARALLAESRAGGRAEELAQAGSIEAAAARRLEEARRTMERSRRLAAEGAISAEALDHAETAYEAARAQWEQAREQQRIVRTGARPERIAVHEAQVRQAEAALEQADAQLENAAIRAPFAGVVAVRHRQPGETVGAGSPVLTVRDPEDRWVRIYIREDRLAQLTLGQSAEVRSDGLRGRSFEGRVSFISGQAEFTPRNVQTAEDRVRLVYMVKVALTGDPEGELKPGLPADVELLPRR